MTARSHRSNEPTFNSLREDPISSPSWQPANSLAQQPYTNRSHHTVTNHSTPQSARQPHSHSHSQSHSHPHIDHDNGGDGGDSHYPYDDGQESIETKYSKLKDRIHLRRSESVDPEGDVKS